MAAIKRDYTVIRSDRKTVALQIKDGEVLVRAPRRMTAAQIRSFVEEHRDWIEKHLKMQEAEQKAAAEQPKLTPEKLNELGEQACRVIPERVQFYAEKIGVTYGNITIRCQRTRWGSCSSLGNLNFNCLLMLMPPEAVDSVVVHELCHRKEMNHSAKFYELVRSAYPDYDRWNRWLKENGQQFLNRLP